MPTTQKPQQKQTKVTQKVGGSTKKPVTKATQKVGGSAKKPVTKATQKVGGSAKKPVTKAMEGGKGKVVAVKSMATMRGGSAKGGSVKTSATKPRQHIGGGDSKTVRRGPSIKKGGSDGKSFLVIKKTLKDNTECFQVINQDTPSTKGSPSKESVLPEYEDTWWGEGPEEPTLRPYGKKNS